MLTACFEEQMKLFAIENCMTEMNVIFLVSLVGIVGLEYIGGNFWGDFWVQFLVVIFELIVWVIFWEKGGFFWPSDWK